MSNHSTHQQVTDPGKLLRTKKPDPDLTDKKKTKSGPEPTNQPDPQP